MNPPMIPQKVSAFSDRKDGLLSGYISNLVVVVIKCYLRGDT